MRDWSAVDGQALELIATSESVGVKDASQSERRVMLQVDYRSIQLPEEDFSPLSLEFAERASLVASLTLSELLLAKITHTILRRAYTLQAFL